mmetsp:Transcript_1297/g.2921  ORF Transcript_1297/g.2921 Transcript_1297/m.2921 type:complete len:122 (+) Transcript_1297:26-391(+)
MTLHPIRSPPSFEIFQITFYSTENNFLGLPHNSCQRQFEILTNILFNSSQQHILFHEHHKNNPNTMVKTFLLREIQMPLYFRHLSSFWLRACIIYFLILHQQEHHCQGAPLEVDEYSCKFQ